MNVLPQFSQYVFRFILCTLDKRWEKLSDIMERKYRAEKYTERSNEF